MKVKGRDMFDIFYGQILRLVIVDEVRKSGKTHYNHE